MENFSIIESIRHKLDPSELNISGRSPDPKIHDYRVRLANIDHLLATCSMIKMVEKRRETFARAGQSIHTISNVAIEISKKPHQISISFPRISESRKIENINIVLPPKPTPIVLDASIDEETDDDGISIDTNALISEDAFDDTLSFENGIDDNNGKNETYLSDAKVVNTKNVTASVHDNLNSGDILRLSSIRSNTEQTKSKKSIMSKIKGLFISKNGVNKSVVQEEPETVTVFSNIASVFKRRSMPRVYKVYSSGKKN